MNTKLIAVLVVVILAVVAVAVIVLGTNAFTDPWWETKTAFGAWHDEIIVEFEDGTTESLKLIEEGRNKPFTVYYGGQAVSKMSIKLSASVSEEGDSGYDGAYFKFDRGTSNFGYSACIQPTGCNCYYVKKTWTSGVDVPMGETKVLVNNPIYFSDLTQSNCPAGTYTVKFKVEGDLQYEPYPGGTWTDVANPPDRSAQIEIQWAPTGQLIVTIHSEIEAS